MNTQLINNAVQFISNATADTVTVKTDGYTVAHVPVCWGAERLASFIKGEARLLGIKDGSIVITDAGSGNQMTLTRTDGVWSQTPAEDDLKAELAQLSADFDNIISRMKDLLDNHAYFIGLNTHD